MPMMIGWRNIAYENQDQRLVVQLIEDYGLQTQTKARPWEFQPHQVGNQRTKILFFQL